MILAINIIDDPRYYRIWFNHDLTKRITALFWRYKILTGFEAFNGPLGKSLNKDVWDIPVGTFEVLQAPGFPTLDKKVRAGMSSDARTLYDLCLVVITGMYEN
jgi:hypothetical protein